MSLIDKLNKYKVTCYECGKELTHTNHQLFHCVFTIISDVTKPYTEGYIRNKPLKKHVKWSIKFLLLKANIGASSDYNIAQKNAKADAKRRKDWHDLWGGYLNESPI